MNICSSATYRTCNGLDARIGLLYVQYSFVSGKSIHLPQSSGHLYSIRWNLDHSSSNDRYPTLFYPILSFLTIVIFSVVSVHIAQSLSGICIKCRRHVLYDDTSGKRSVTLELAASFAVVSVYITCCNLVR